MHSRLLLSMGSAAALLAMAPQSARAEERPALDPDRPVTCIVDEQLKPWRVQCSEDSESPKQCLIAVDGERNSKGEVVRPLERARRCRVDKEMRLSDMAAKGYAMVRADADSPRGWMRDGRGRVFQVTFDLHRRMYAGVIWAPTLRRGDTGEGAEYGRTGFEVGLLELEGNTGDHQSGFRHRLRIAEGTVNLAPFGADATLLRYDISRRRSDPLFRLTTFWGTPRRYDVDAHIGGWIEIAHLTMAEVAPDKTETLMRFGTAHLTWDLWRTASMDSFVRLRSGAGLERAHIDLQTDRNAVTWATAAEADVTVGDKGFHRLTATAQWERPMYFDRQPNQAQFANRSQLKAGYERIILAVNDQPVSLRIAGEAEYRDDVPEREAGWDMRAMAGLRFNLWAPAR